jgi:hypothetical protein
MSQGVIVSSIAILDHCGKQQSNPPLLEFTLHAMHGQPKNSGEKHQDWFHDNYPLNQDSISNHAVCFRLIFLQTMLHTTGFASLP